MIRIVFALMSAVLIYGLTVTREWTQSLWTPTGWERFVLVMSLTAVVVLGLPRAVFYALALILALQTGVLPILGVGFTVWGALNLGWLLFRNTDDRLNLLGGVAIYVWIFSLTAGIPVNTAWLWGALLALPIALGRKWTLPLPKPSLPIAMPLVAYFLLALKAEVSADGLSQHLAAIQWVKDFARFHFDAANQIWSVQPMNGDWAYTIAALFGGEYAARLLNVVWLLLITSFVFRALRRRLDHLPAALATGVFLSMPMLQLTTTSLFVENFWTVLVCGALFAVEGGAVPLAGALLGAAAGAKLLGLLPALGIAGYATWTVFRKSNWRAAAQCVVLFCAIAIIPYARAYRITGNPVFHYANTFFKSPLISTTENFVDLRFPPRFNWHTLWDVTFHTNLFIESEPGTAGYQWLLLLPVVLVAMRRLNAMERAAAFTALLTVALIFTRQASLRYVEVSMALLVIASGGAIAQVMEDRWLKPLAAAFGILIFALNLHAMPGASWYHRDFCLKPFSWRERERYLEKSAPQRILIDKLNRIAPGTPVAFFDGDGIAGLRAPSWTSTWHTPKFSIRLDEAHSIEQFYLLAREFNVGYIMAPAPNRGRMLQQNPMRTFLEEATEPVAVCDYLQLVRVKPGFDPVHLKPAGPGRYDDFNTRIIYEGPWYFNDQFPLAAHGTISYTPDAKAFLRFEFTGTRLTYVYTKAPNRTKGSIEIDGVQRGTYDFASPEVQWQARLVFDNLGPGAHTFILRHQGPGGLHIDVDELIAE